MKSLIIFTLLLISCTLSASKELKSNYFVKKNYVMLSDIIQDPKEDVLLYKFDINKHTKRVKTKELIKKLKQYDLKEYSLKHSYIQFSQTSPIDTSRIKHEIKHLYIKSYKNIIINKVTIEPRSYLTSIPNSYEIKVPKRYYLSNSGILYIKTVSKKKIFFNYTVDATIKVFMARDKIKKDDEISNRNIKESSIIFDKFKAMPLQKIQKSTLQAKHNVKTDRILTKNDVIGLFLIKRGSNVDVILNKSNISISISAKAKQNGKYGQTIYVITKNGKKIRVVVTGRNRAEVK